MLAVFVPGRPHEVEHVFLALQVHCEPLEAVGDLAGDRIAVKAPDLLEIGELRDLHSVQPHFPAQAPRTERRVLPVVLDEADVVLLEIEAKRLERPQIEVEDVRRRRFQHDLVLVVVLHSVGILAVPAVLGPPRRLHVSRAPRLGPQSTQKRRGMRRARPDLHVVRLQQRTALRAPVVLELADNLLKAEHQRGGAWRDGLDITG